MIVAKLTNHRLEVTGHAPRPKGSEAEGNLVCAAVSALTQTARDALREIGGMELYAVKGGEANEGLMSFEWGLLTPKGGTILETYALGMRALADTYPEAVEILYSPEG